MQLAIPMTGRITKNTFGKYQMRMITLVQADATIHEGKHTCDSPMKFWCNILKEWVIIIAEVQQAPHKNSRARRGDEISNRLQNYTQLAAELQSDALPKIFAIVLTSFEKRETFDCLDRGDETSNFVTLSISELTDKVSERTSTLQGRLNRIAEWRKTIEVNLHKTKTDLWGPSIEIL
jgi:hypothetical protein